jgi:hypothetical protein
MTNSRLGAIRANISTAESNQFLLGKDIGLTSLSAGSTVKLHMPMSFATTGIYFFFLNTTQNSHAELGSCKIRLFDSDCSSLCR